MSYTVFLREKTVAHQQIQQRQHATPRDTPQDTTWLLGTPQDTTLSGCYGREASPIPTLPVADEVLEVIVEVSRKIFHLNTLTVVLISRHDSLTNITQRIYSETNGIATCICKSDSEL